MAQGFGMQLQDEAPCHIAAEVRGLGTLHAPRFRHPPAHSNTHTAHNTHGTCTAQHSTHNAHTTERTPHRSHHLARQADLAALNAQLPVGQPPVAMSRFRPNVVLGGCGPYEQDSWRRVRIAGDQQGGRRRQL
jgi:uncharacterized protein YcbX